MCVHTLNVLCTITEKILSQMHVCSVSSSVSRDTTVGQFGLAYQRSYHLPINTCTNTINILCTPPLRRNPRG